MSERKNHSGKTALRRLLAVLLVCAAALSLFAGCKKEDAKTDAASTAPSGTAAPAESPAPTDSADPAAPTETLDPTIDYDGLKTLERYTVTDLAEDDPRLDKVIARCGTKELTNRQLQINFYLQLFSYVNQVSQYGYSPSMLGLDLSKPLSEQPCMDVKGLSWEQYFLLLSLDQFHQFAAVSVKAEADNYEMNEETLKQLQSVKEGLNEEAANGGYETLDAYLLDSFGPGVGQAEYENYMELYFYVMSYENQVYENIEYTDEDLLAYFNAHQEDYAGVTTDQENINVRHILITPEADADGKSSDEQWAAAKAKAEELLAEYEKDPTEAHFTRLATDNTADPGSKNTGGLYEDVYPGQMVQAFNDWCFDQIRKPGDTGIVETTYGYHVMYFVKKTGTFYWQTLAKRDYPTSIMRTLLQEYLDESPLDVSYADIVLHPLPKVLQPEVG